MKAKDVISNLVKTMMQGQNNPNFVIEEIIKLDEETLQVGSIKHMCNKTGVLSNIKFQKGQIRINEIFYDITLAFCPNCFKTYYDMVEIERMDLTELKQQYKMMFPTMPNPTKQVLLANVFPTEMEVQWIEPPQATVLESPFNTASLNKGSVNKTNQELKKQRKVTQISSWDDI